MVIKAKLHDEDREYFEKEEKLSADAEKIKKASEVHTEVLVSKLAQLPLSEVRVELSKMNAGAMVKGFYMNLVIEAKRNLLIN